MRRKFERYEQFFIRIPFAVDRAGRNMVEANRRYRTPKPYYDGY